MKKIISGLLITILVFSVCVFSGCKDYSDYKNTPGYEAYISDRDSGYEDVPYFATHSSMDYGQKNEEKAREYYENNSRRVDNFIITNYEDGICINRFINYPYTDEVNIPEIIDGKPVIKLGSYPEYDEGPDNYDAISAFSNADGCVLNVPSTVKYIDYQTLRQYRGDITSQEEIDDSPHIAKINVDEDNPYYYSENGVLYTKDKKTLLYLDYSSVCETDEDKRKCFTVPDFVEVFKPMEAVSEDYDCLAFGKNIKKIDASTFDYWELIDYAIGVTVKGYKGTAAEEWAKEKGLEFITLDENETETQSDTQSNKENKIYYKYDEDTGTLTITGEGKMRYDENNRPPWDHHRNSAKVVISEGITTIAPYTFSWYSNLSEVTIPQGVETIEAGAFVSCGMKEITIPASVTTIGREAIGFYEDPDGWYSEAVEDFTIKGYKGSTAEQYATENGFNFVALDE